MHIAPTVSENLDALRNWWKRLCGSRVRRRWRYVGSLLGHRLNKRHTFRSGLRAILRDFFRLTGEPPVYIQSDFERLFRVQRCVFLRMYKAVNVRAFYLAQRINASGRLQAYSLQQVVAAFRVNA